MKRSVVCMASALILGCPVLCAADGGDVVGWRTDGTGKYPDADPPTTWSVSENVVWKTPLPAWSNATPVRVGDRLFLCVEPATLLCVDARTGTVLWERATTYYDAMPAEEAARLKALADRINVERTQRELRNARGRISRLEAGLRAKTGELARLKREAARPPDEAATAAKLAADIVRVEGELPALQAEVEAQKPAMEAAAAEIERKLEPVRPLLMPDTHGANGYSSPTPVSDGSRVFVFFTTGLVAGFDLDGRRLWTAMTEKPSLTYGVSASPLLAEGKVLVHPHDVHALDAATGKTVWRQPSAPLWGTPALAEIEGRQVLLANNGDWLLVEDGTKIATRTAKASYNQPLVANGVVYYVENGGGAFRLPERIGEPPARLWRTSLPGGRYYASPVLHDGILYDISEEGILVAIDAADGALVYQQKLDLGRQQCFPSVTMAGAMLAVHGSDGVTVLFEPGRAFREVGRNTLEPFRATPVFAGTRMYVRTLKHLYCIGR